MSGWQIVALMFLSGFASIDRLAGMNIMLSRPIVIAGIVGYIFGVPLLCLMVGILFEFVGMVEVPVGTVVTHDDTFAGYASAVLVGMGAASYNAVSLLFCVFITVIMMYPVTLTDKYCRYFNRVLIINSLRSENKDFESKLIFYGVVIAFLRGVLVYNAGVLVIWSCLYVIDKAHLTEYSPYVSLTVIAMFMCGYLVRFLSVTNALKVGLLACGMVFGWLVL